MKAHQENEVNHVVTLRKFPYPYQAALAICSDIDGTSFENFIKIQRFLNTNDVTELGVGLGLPIGNSFWMYDSPNIASHAFSYFKDLEGNPSEHAPIMRDFIKAGILDVLHSYGNFAAIRYFSRSLAQKALEELDKHNLKVKVWTNHGGIESVQNIGKNALGLGDFDDSEFYHADLLLKYGVRFYWDSEYSLMTNIGQDCPATFGDAYWRSPFYRTMKSRGRSFIKGVLAKSEKFIYPAIKKHVSHWEAFDGKENDLILLDTLRDGNEIYKFKRTGLGRFDWSDDIPRLLHRRVIQKLVEKQGYMILYVHLGDRKDKNNELPISKGTIDTLRNISNLYHDGKLWIVTTSRLLDYNFLYKNIDWRVEESSDLLTIKIEQLKEFDDGYEPGGLTFYVPGDKKIEIFYNSKSCRFIKNSQDDQGRFSITIPFHKIDWPL